jgi:protein-disulfide isomerase
MSNQESKTSLILGIAIGIAVISTIGFFVLLAKDQSGDTGQVVGNLNTNVAPTPSPTPSPTPIPSPPSSAGDFSKISAVSNSDYIRGDKNAPVTLIEYSDFQCPFCKRHVPTISQLLSDYEGKVRFVYRHFPLNSIHPNAQKAAEAFECAGEQNKAWEMHDVMFDNQSALAVTNLKSYAGNLGLSQGQFDDCLDSGKYASKVNQQAQEAQAAGITGTPGTFVNDQLVKGAYPIDTFKQIIDDLLK